jgi:ribosome-associated protein
LKDSTPLALARMAGRLALSKKGFDIKILKLKDISSVCDYFVIASGSADKHVQAIAEAVKDGLRENSVRPNHVEGLEFGEWVLLDYFDLVVHVFSESARQYYALEKLWGDAPIEELTD